MAEPTDSNATSAGSEMPCVRCGACLEVCPDGLQPALLLRFVRAGELESAAAQGLFDCSECSRCDPVCPSRIPLLQVFRDGKQEIRQRAQSRAIADAARDRYRLRQERLQREAAESAVRSSERKAQASADAVAAALERAKARRQPKDPGTES
jgi:electron transport complex protein RnfC